MSVCAFILCLCCPCDELIPRPRSPTICVKKDDETEAEASAQQRAVEPLMFERINERFLCVVIINCAPLPRIQA
jgi:hypothetical protein